MLRESIPASTILSIHSLADVGVVVVVVDVVNDDEEDDGDDDDFDIDAVIIVSNKPFVVTRSFVVDVDNDDDGVLVVAI